MCASKSSSVLCIVKSGCPGDKSSAEYWARDVRAFGKTSRLALSLSSCALDGGTRKGTQQVSECVCVVC